MGTSGDTELPKGSSGKGPKATPGLTPAGHAVVTAVPSAVPPPPYIELPL